MTDAIRSQLRAILTRAADAEASRQQAVADRDWTRAQALENELRELWQAHGDLERQVA
jgi:ribose 1,5-bisphosphokinase PhnN